MADTIFGKILRGEAPAEFVYQDDRAIVIRDIAPKAPVHLLVIPRKPIARLSQAEDADAELLGHLLLVARRVAAEAGLTDWRLVINDGAGAGQTVFHLHLHVLGGGRLPWSAG